MYACGIYVGTSLRALSGIKGQSSQRGSGAEPPEEFLISYSLHEIMQTFRLYDNYTSR